MKWSLRTSVAPDDPLMESGVDSLAATELQNSLQRELGKAVKLPSTVMFDYPTSASIAEFVQSALAPKAAPAQHEGLEASAAASSTLAFDSLTAADIAQSILTATDTVRSHKLAIPSNTDCLRTSSAEVSYISKTVVGIIGMACLASSVNAPSQLWDTLVQESCQITTSPPDRWRKACALSNAPQAALVGAFIGAGALDEIKRADVAQMDLHVQLLTTVMSKALDDTGSVLQSKEMGIFTAAQPADFPKRVSSSIISRTVALVLKAAGPHGNSDAECSSGYLALASARNAIQAGECNVAAAGGVFMLLKPDLAIGSLASGMMSPTGSCTPLSEAANGTIWGEAGSAVVLQQNPRPGASLVSMTGHAVVENNPKLPLGFADPDTMAAATTSALLCAGLQPTQVALVHLHAMGSLPSDLPEAQGVLPVLTGSRTADQLVLLGHKSSFGHSVAASGILGAIVTALALQHRVVPVPANFGKPLQLLQETKKILIPTSGPHLLDTSSTMSGVTNGTSFSGHNVHAVFQHNLNHNRPLHSVFDTATSMTLEQMTCKFTDVPHQQPDQTVESAPFGATATAPLATDKSLELIIMNQIKSVLGEAVDPAMPLMQAGLKSSQVVPFMQSLQGKLGPAAPKLPQTLIFSHPTVHAIAHYVEAHLTSPGTEAVIAQPQSTNRAMVASYAMHQKGLEHSVGVVAVHCVAPGGCDSISQLSTLLGCGQDPICDPPVSRCESGIDMLRGHFVQHAESFDHKMFYMSPIEVRVTDPCQRVLLEASFGVLVKGGKCKERLVNAEIGVFVGCGQTPWTEVLRGTERTVFSAHGTTLSAVAGRVSYTLGLRGPCLAIDTACSASLVALDTAVKTLQQCACDSALAAGVSLHPHGSSWVTMPGLPLAPDGKSKTFDSAANGYGRGEGCFVMVLEPHNSQWRLHGTAVNQDGRSANFAAPNGTAQERVVTAALQQATLDLSSHAVETHGTGTVLGDPIEVEALKSVMQQGLGGAPVAMGALKTRIGHTEHAAGMAGMIKALVVLQQRCVLPNLHLQQLNSHLEDLSGFEVFLPSQLASGSAVHSIGVSSFGFTGTNSHAVLMHTPGDQNELVAAEHLRVAYQHSAFIWWDTSSTACN